MKAANLKLMGEVARAMPYDLTGAVARMDAPEADLVAVANGDFSGLSLPILVACHDEMQLEEFRWREALVCTEVMRYRGDRLSKGSITAHLPGNKILLLLPGWDSDLATKDAVDLWVHGLDRFTVELRSPRPLVRKPRNLMGLALLGAGAWGAVGMLAWWVFRGSMNF